MKKETLKNLLSCLAVLLVFCLLLSLVTMLLQPKYMTDQALPPTSGALPSSSSGSPTMC